MRRGRRVKWYGEVSRIKNGRAEGAAAEADGKDVLEGVVEWWRFGGAANGDDGTGLGEEQTGKTKRAQDKVTSAGRTTGAYSLS
jgi:hypothetical protein